METRVLSEGNAREVQKDNPVSHVQLDGYEAVFLPFFRIDSQYYGGNQSWYPTAYQRDRGCACVAAANFFAYWAMQDPSLKVLYPYDLSQGGFTACLCDLWQDITPGWAGYWWMRHFVKDVQNYAKGKGIETLKGCWSQASANLQNGVRYVKEGLKRNCPVALIIHFNRSLSAFSWHWMLITGIQDILDDNGNGRVTVTVSSWGRQYTLDFKRIVYDSSYASLMYFTW